MKIAATGSAHGRMATIAGPGLVFWGFSVTFMSIDWVLSLNPHWFSTIFGLLFMAGQGLSSMAFLITLMVLLSHREPMSRVLTHRHLHDLGKFLLALVMVWAYFSFSQFLIIWAGNLPEEIPWYMVRMNGGVGLCGAGPGVRTLRAAVRAAALARPQAQFQAALAHRGLHHVDALRGSVLGGGARFRQRRFLAGWISPRRSGWAASGWRIS